LLRLEDGVDVAGRAALVEGEGDGGATDHVHLGAGATARELRGKRGESPDDLVAVHL